MLILHPSESTLYTTQLQFTFAVKILKLSIPRILQIKYTESNKICVFYFQ